MAVPIYKGPKPAAQYLLHPAFTATEAQRQAWIQGNPTYTGWMSGQAKLEGTSAAARRAAVQQAYINYGGALPPGMTDAYGDIDPATKALAAANQFSTVRTLGRQNDLAVQQAQNALAARGALHSGDLGQQLSDLANQYAAAQQAAGTQFGTDYGTNVANLYTNPMSDYNAGYGTMLGGVSAAEAAAHPDTPATYAALVPNWQHYGKPIYQDGPGGTLYEIGSDGNLTPYTGPA